MDIERAAMLWRRGWGTDQIAKAMLLHESVVYNLLGRIKLAAQQQAKRDGWPQNVKPPSWLMGRGLVEIEKEKPDNGHSI